VEVISPWDSYTDVESKTRDWLDGDTREVWVVDPRKHVITVHRTGEDSPIFLAGETLESPQLLPGFRVAVDEVFDVS